MMEVNGEAVLSLPRFIMKKFGAKKYNSWLDSLSPQAQEIFRHPISKTDWHPLRDSNEHHVCLAAGGDSAGDHRHCALQATSPDIRAEVGNSRNHSERTRNRELLCTFHDSNVQIVKTSSDIRRY